MQQELSLSEKQWIRVFNWLLYKQKEVDVEVEDLNLARKILPFLPDRYKFRIQDMEESLKENS